MNPQESQDFGHYYDGWREARSSMMLDGIVRIPTPATLTTVKGWECEWHEPIEAYQAYHWRLAFRGGGE